MLRIFLRVNNIAQPFQHFLIRIPVSRARALRAVAHQRCAECGFNSRSRFEHRRIQHKRLGDLRVNPIIDRIRRRAPAKVFATWFSISATPRKPCFNIPSYHFGFSVFERLSRRTVSSSDRILVCGESESDNVNRRTTFVRVSTAFETPAEIFEVMIDVSDSDLK